MESTLHEMVLQASAHHADRNAVCFHSSDQQQVFYTYRELMVLAQQLKDFLKARCGAEKCRIGLYCQPGINLPAWILGILMVPATYCPIDPSAPSQFTSPLMERCGLKFIIVENNKVEKFKLLFRNWTEQNSSPVQHLDVTLFKHSDIVQLGNEHVYVTDIPKQYTGNALRCTEHQMCAEHVDIHSENGLAYVLHTSGSTGTPKVVSVPHSCIVPNIHHLRSIFNIKPHDRLFLASPLTFDPSVVEVFLALSTGACLLLVPDSIRMMPHKLCDLLFHQHKVTVLQVTPTFLRRFSSYSIQSSVLSRETSLRILALGGEPFPAIDVIRRWRELGNKTRIFNLYGITEVSSWATYYEIPEKMLTSETCSEHSVPLGIPLQGTAVELQNEDGCKIEEGEGQVLLGGRERICFLDDEVTLPCGTMRKTGDWVTVKSGEMFFLGRKDNQFKRHGKRLNTEYIQQVVECLSQVDTCAVLWSESKQLIVFVIPRGSVDKKILWQELLCYLPGYAVPDDIIMIESLPLTKHGKVDMSKLNTIYCDYLREKKRIHLLQENDLWDSLQNTWKHVLGLSKESPAVAEDSLFLLGGGDSLTAIRFHNEIEVLVGKNVPDLMEVILSQTILDIYRHVSRVVYPKEEQNIDDIVAETTIRDDTSITFQGKRKDLPETEPTKDVESFLSLSRGNCLYVNMPLPSELVTHLYHIINEPNQEMAEFLYGSQTIPEFKRPKLKLSVSHNPSILNIRTNGLSLQVRWKSDTGKCVDASPLLVQSTSKNSPVTIYIGSHSHRMQAIDLQSGRVIWERVLGDRIESSTAITKCGNFVLVGCYDGSLYALIRNNGETHWIHTTADAIKSSPVVDSSTGLVFVGSHDHHLYALDIVAKQCVWKTHCGGGAVYASPCVSSKPHQVYVATLGGSVLAIHPVTGNLIWTYVCGKPVFSSPQCNQTHIFVGCVDEHFYCLNNAGEKVWHLTTNGPIFSSPCLSSLSKKIMFGSHDGFVYCCNTEGVLLWRYKTGSRVFATPFLFPDTNSNDRELLAVASTDGHLWILDAQTGLQYGQYKLEGEVFSSPVVWRGSLIVGCRNDYVYCLDLLNTATEK